MAETILPFDVNPAGPLQRLTAYWYATLCRVAYQNNVVLSTRAHAIGGGGPVTLTPARPPLVPALEIGHYPDDARVVVIQGTTRWQQYIVEAYGSPLFNTLTFPGWGFSAGSISGYFGALAALIWNDTLRALVADKDYTLCGHSLGAVVAALISTLGGLAEGPHTVIDIGSPRPGNAIHAGIAWRIDRLRITNQGDPVPLVPPSTNTILDSVPTVPFVPAPPTTYRHWGDRVHLWPDGSATRPAEASTPTEVTRNLLTILNASTTWLNAHHTGEYCRRLRCLIPVPWPCAAPDPDFPGLVELDQLHVELNDTEGFAWPPVVGPGGEQTQLVGPGAGGWAANLQFQGPGDLPRGRLPFRDFQCD